MYMRRRAGSGRMLALINPVDSMVMMEVRTVSSKNLKFTILNPSSPPPPNKMVGCVYVLGVRGREGQWK